MKKFLQRFCPALALLTSAAYSQDIVQQQSLEEVEESGALLSSFNDTSSPTSEFAQKREQTKERLALLAQSHPSVLTLFEHLSNELCTAIYTEQRLTPSDAGLIFKAVLFAAEQHKAQMRKHQPVPYITHLLDVTYRLLRIGKIYDPSILIPALLHDVPSYARGAIPQIQEAFGPIVAHRIQQICHTGNLSNAEKKREEIAAVAKHPPAVAQIELADLLCNVEEVRISAPKSWSQAHKDRYIGWAQTLAARLGAVNQGLYKAVQNEIDVYWEQSGRPGPLSLTHE